MEHPHSEKKLKTSEKTQIILLVFIGILILLLIIAIVVIIKNVDEIRSDPVNYAIRNTPINSCTCYLDSGVVQTYQEDVIENWTT